VGGKYHRFTITTLNRKEVERWAREKFDKLERAHGRQLRGLRVGVKMVDLLTYFEAERLPRLAPNTQRAYTGSIKSVRAFFIDRLGDLPLEDIEDDMVTEFLDWRRHHRLNGDEALHGRTVEKDRAVLHRLFTVAQARKWCKGNPVTQETTPEGQDSRQPVILTTAEYHALLEACPDPQVRLFVLFCGETGARCESEALWLRWEDIDFDAGFVTIVSGRGGHRTKGGRSRSVPLTARVREALKAYFAAHRFAAYDGVRPEYVFHHTRTRRHYQAGQRVRSFRRAVDSAVPRAKVLNGTPEGATLPAQWVMHDLRHRRITTWLAEGKSPVLVKEALGHADLKTTMGYTHLAKEHLRALVEEPTTATPAQAQAR